MSYEHCDAHDWDATNGCPHCVREQLTEEYGIAPHEVFTLISDLCAFWDTALHAGLVAPGLPEQYIGVGKLAREGLWHLARERCEDVETALGAPPELSDEEVRELMTAPVHPSALAQAEAELHATRAQELGDSWERELMIMASLTAVAAVPGVVSFVAGLMSGDLGRIMRALSEMTGQFGLRARLLALLRARTTRPRAAVILTSEVDHPPEVQARIDQDVRRWYYGDDDRE